MFSKFKNSEIYSSLEMFNTIAGIISIFGSIATFKIFKEYLPSMNTAWIWLICWFFAIFSFTLLYKKKESKTKKNEYLPTFAEIIFSKQKENHQKFDIIKDKTRNIKTIISTGASRDKNYIKFDILCVFKNDISATNLEVEIKEMNAEGTRELQTLCCRGFNSPRNDLINFYHIEMEGELNIDNCRLKVSFIYNNN